MGIHSHVEKLTGQTPFKLVYGAEVVMPMEYIVPSLQIEALIAMSDHEALEECYRHIWAHQPQTYMSMY